MTKQYLSRTEAAKVLGCDPQSISNYAARGLFETMKGDKCVYIEKSSFEKFVNEYYETVKAHEDVKAALDKELADYTAEVDKKLKEIRNVEELINTKKNYQSLCKFGYMAHIANFMIEALGEDAIEEDRDCFQMVVNGFTYYEIAKQKNVTRQRVAQRAERFFYKMRRGVSKVEQEHKENIALRQRCARQHDMIKELQKALVDKENGIKAKKAFGIKPLLKLKNIKIYDCDLSVRALNGLKYRGVDTLYDLICIDKSKLKDARSVGKKTIDEIEMFLKDESERLGIKLSLGMLA